MYMYRQRGTRALVLNYHLDLVGRTDISCRRLICQRYLFHSNCTQCEKEIYSEVFGNFIALESGNANEPSLECLQSRLYYRGVVPNDH